MNGCSRHAVRLVDLDRVKVIDESLGREAGETLLVEAADRLRGSLQPDDVVARLGGDEFVVILQRTKREQRFLREHGCEEMQGYLFSSRLPPRERGGRRRCLHLRRCSSKPSPPHVQSSESETRFGFSGVTRAPEITGGRVASAQ